MNRTERRAAQSSNNTERVIRWRGKSYTIEEADALAMKELSVKHAQAAADIYDLILARVPGQAGVYNNRGVALHTMKQYGEALASYDKAIGLRADYAEAHNNRSEERRVGKECR